jgi:hypothetical protein
MRTMATRNAGRLSHWLLLLALVGAALLATSCAPPRSLSRDEVEGRAQDYYVRGMDQFQRGEFRAALESFRLAKAYDPTTTNRKIADMIEKTEARLRIGGAPVAASGPGVAPTSAAATTNVFRTYRSRLYPYAIDIPEDWIAEPGGAQVANTPADLLSSPKGGQPAASASIVAHLLPPDIDGRAYVEANLKLLRSQGMRPDELGKRSVDGFEATLLRTRVITEQGKLVNMVAIFASERIGWGLTFSAGADDGERLQPFFHRLLDSFRVTGQQSV